MPCGGRWICLRNGSPPSWCCWGIPLRATFRRRGASCRSTTSWPSAEMPHTYTNGIVTFYEDAGDGPVVVLIHGHSLDLRMWQYQVPALVNAGFRVVRHDVRGHGRSLIAPSGYTWENYSADLRDLLDRLNVERPTTETLHVPAVHLVGLSMGGGVALQFTLDNPQRVISLTLVDSALPGYAYSEEMSKAIQELVHAVPTEGT